MKINKKLIKAIKDYILEDENKEEIIGELKRYKDSFPSVLDYNWYKYGNILPYYSQIRDFYKSIEVEAPENDNMLQKHFEGHIRYAIDEILAEDNARKGSKTIIMMDKYEKFIYYVLKTTASKEEIEEVFQKVKDEKPDSWETEDLLQGLNENGIEYELISDYSIVEY